MDADQIGDFAPTMFAASPGPSVLAGLSQTGDSFDRRPQRVQPGGLLRRACQVTGTLLGDRRTPAVMTQFVADRTRRVMQAAGNCPQLASLLKA
ncbi:MAG: hypothetical protein VB142_07130 [Burkholderia sp.]